MPARVRAALALALLAVPGLAAGVGPAPGLEAAFVLAAERAPAAGEALAARVALRGPPGLAVEARAWLAGEGVGGAQVWAADGWARSDRYQLAWSLDAAGALDAWVAVRAAELGRGSATVQLRVRTPDGRVVGEAARPLLAPEGPPRIGLAPAEAAAVGAWLGGHLTALAPVAPRGAADSPWDLPGRFALRAPEGAELRAVGEDGRVGEPFALPPPGALRIAALLVDPAADEAAEFVRVANAGAGPEPLAGWAVEGPGWRAVARGGVLAPGGTAAFARDAAAYAALTGRGDALADVGVQGMFQLANAGGHAALARWGEPADTVAWGRAPEAPGWRGPPLPLLAPGFLHRRTSADDTDTAADFAGGARGAGWGERPVLRAEARAAAFTTEDAHAVAAAALSQAREEVLLEVYALTHEGLAGALHEALRRGVRVGVAVEAAPVGGVPGAQAALLDGLARAGAQVWAIGASGRDRYATVHAKFAVLDGVRLLLGSENWTPSGFPLDGRGNRGWGLLVEHEGLAAFFADVWREDADPSRGDVAPWVPRSPGWAPAAPPAGAPPALAPATVRALLVPDNAGAEVLDLVARARATLEVEALQLPASWEDQPSVVLEALLAAARRGVSARVLLDGSPGTENAAAVARLLDAAAREGLSLEARLARGARVHNKAILADGAEALVGSINFGEASMTRNREAALLVEGALLHRWRDAFEADWQAAEPPPPPVRAEPAALVAPLAAFALLAAWRGRRRPR